MKFQYPIFWNQPPILNSLCYPKVFGLNVPLLVIIEKLLGAANPLKTDEIHEFFLTFSSYSRYLLCPMPGYIPLLILPASQIAYKIWLMIRIYTYILFKVKALSNLSKLFSPRFWSIKEYLIFRLILKTIVLYFLNTFLLYIFL